MQGIKAFIQRFYLILIWLSAIEFAYLNLSIGKTLSVQALPIADLCSDCFQSDSADFKMTDQFLGKFKLTSSDKFDDFLKELGVNFVLRNLAKTSTPIVEITKDGDLYSIKTTTTIKNSEIKFKLGEEFTEDRMDGAKVKTKVEADGNKLIQTQYGDKEVKIVREFNGDELKVTASVGNVTSVRIYNRIS